MQPVNCRRSVSHKTSQPGPLAQGLGHTKDFQFFAGTRSVDALPPRSLHHPSCLLLLLLPRAVTEPGFIRTFRLCHLPRFLESQSRWRLQSPNHHGFVSKSPHSHSNCLHSKTPSHPQRSTTACSSCLVASFLCARPPTCRLLSQTHFSCRIGQHSRFFLSRRKSPVARVPIT